MEDKMTYAQATKRLEEIVDKVEHSEQDIDALADLLKEAKELIAFCRERLYKVDQSVKEILEDEA
jgi:exodeoxyribonuclease VII small subunit